MCLGALANGSEWKRNSEAFSTRSIDPTLAVDSQGSGGLQGAFSKPGDSTGQLCRPRCWNLAESARPPSYQVVLLGVEVSIGEVCIAPGVAVDKAGNVSEETDGVVIKVLALD